MQRKLLSVQDLTPEFLGDLYEKLEMICQEYRQRQQAGQEIPTGQRTAEDMQREAEAMAQALTPWQRPGPGGGPPPGPQGPPGPPAAGQPPSGQQGGFGPATPATQEPTAPQGGLRTPSVLPPQFATLGSNIHNPIPVGQAGGFGPYRPAQAAGPAAVQADGYEAARRRGRNTNASERYQCTAFWGNQRLWQGS